MSGGAWSKFPVWQTASLGTAGNIDSPNLGAFRELMLEVKGLGIGAGTPDFMVQVGVDGVFNAVDYIHGGATGTTGFFIATAVAVVPVLVAANVELLHFNVAIQTWARIRGGREGSTSGSRSQGGYNTLATAWNCIRITNSTATPFTANGGISVYSKQPE